MEKEKELINVQELLAKLLVGVSETGKIQALAYIQGIKDKEQLIKIS